MIVYSREVAIDVHHHIRLVRHVNRDASIHSGGDDCGIRDDTSVEGVQRRSKWLRTTRWIHCDVSERSRGNRRHVQRVSFGCCRNAAARLRNREITSRILTHAWSAERKCFRALPCVGNAAGSHGNKSQSRTDVTVCAGLSNQNRLSRNQQRRAAGVDVTV